MSHASPSPTAEPGKTAVPSADEVDLMLAEMAQAGRRHAVRAVESAPAPAQRQTLQRVRYSHEAMAEMLSKDGKGYLPFPKEVVKRAMMLYDIPYPGNAAAIKPRKTLLC